MPPIPADLLDHRIRAEWYSAIPQLVVGRLIRTLAAGLIQTTPEGRDAVDVLGRWLRGDATADECRAAAGAAWEAAVREWDRAAPLMGRWPTDTDPRTPGDIVAAAASAVETALPNYPEAAARADSYAAAVLGWPGVRRVLEQAFARGGEDHG